GVWALFGAVAIAAVTTWAPRDRTPLLAAVLAVAALWQVTPWKRRALLNGHRAVPLPPRGLRATVADVHFGLRYGAACVGSCWALMLAMVVAPSGHLLWTATLAVVVTAEKTLPRPRRTSRRVAYALAAASGVTLVLAGATR
ncbi:MAG TPA: DUF2182 domain-containing protein, partial [Longimicrobium sp.]|nr:DUF2182 domain-containing protein [Longimicrobium sp.]